MWRDRELRLVKGGVRKVVPSGTDSESGGVDEDEGRVDTENDGDLNRVCCAELLHARIGDDESEGEPAVGVDVVVEMGVIGKVGRREVELDLTDGGEDLHGEELVFWADGGGEGRRGEEGLKVGKRRGRNWHGGERRGREEVGVVCLYSREDATVTEGKVLVVLHDAMIGGNLVVVGVMYSCDWLQRQHSAI